MNSFLVKKINTNRPAILSIAWSEHEGTLAIGGSEGFLKIVQIDEKEQSPHSVLEYHQGNVVRLLWNDKFRKLTSVDSAGLIIVWLQRGNRWFEEMVNDRAKSTVADIKWSPDGEKIGIVYEDGYVIMGSVEGSNLWSKEIKEPFRLMEWFPDSRSILIGTSRGEVFVYDEGGDPINQIKMLGLDKLVSPDDYSCPKLPLAAIEWYQDAEINALDVPSGLCIAYKVGRLILMRNDRDDNPLAIDTSLEISAVKWSPAGGSVLAVAGTMIEGD
jgi:WD repeat-containing protein 35